MNLITNFILQPIILSLLLFILSIIALAKIGKVYGKFLVYLILLVSILDHGNFEELHKITNLLDLFFK